MNHDGQTVAGTSRNSSGDTAWKPAEFIAGLAGRGIILNAGSDDGLYVKNDGSLSLDEHACLWTNRAVILAALSATTRVA